jgi:hypothetical protein
MTDAERHAAEAGRPIVDPAAGFAAAEAEPAPAGSTPPAAPPFAPASPPATTVQPLADVIARPERRSRSASSLLMVLAGAVAIGGLAFAAGRLTAPAAAAGPGGTGQLPGGGQLSADGQGFPGRGQGFGGMSIQGTVTAVTSNEITIELASGSTVTIPVDADTTYRSATAATADAVKVGSEVAVTPGARAADPDATPHPDAEPGLAGGGISFGAASEVTVVEP